MTVSHLTFYCFLSLFDANQLLIAVWKNLSSFGAVSSDTFCTIPAANIVKPIRVLDDIRTRLQRLQRSHMKVFFLCAGIKAKKEVHRLRAMVTRFHGELQNVDPTPQCEYTD